MNIQDFTTELQLTLDQNTSLKKQVERYEIYIKKLAFDSGGIINIEPFKSGEHRELLREDYDLAFGVTTIELVKK